MARRPIYEFGTFRLDPARRRLETLEGQAVPLTAKAFDALVHLVEHAGEPISRKALTEALWPNTVVEENNLTQAIAALRRALGKDCIVTLPGRGYQFVGDVRSRQSASPAAAPLPSSTTSGPAAQPRVRPLGHARARDVVVTAVAAAAVGAAAIWFSIRDPDGRWLQDEAIPAIETALESGDWGAAYEVAVSAAARVPNDPELAELWPRFSWRATIETDPPGATVYRRDYDASAKDWQVLGTTPLEDIRVPFGLSRLRFELDGYVPLLRTVGGGVLVTEEMPEASVANMPFTVGTEVYRLETAQTLPEGKVRVPQWSNVVAGERIELSDFFLDRYEVTNAEFKTFLDAGGYEDPAFWDPVVRDGRVLPWQEAMVFFVDRTGRPGPSTWQAGVYGDGQADLPVTGVSWYEAAAYARFKGEQLPTLHHWLRASAGAELAWLLPASNLDADGLLDVGVSDAMSHVGAYDLIGNAREWTATASKEDPERRFIVGSAWSDSKSAAAYSLPTARALDRSPTNGLRLAITRDDPADVERATAPALERLTWRPPQREPVSDELFSAYSRVFAYGERPLDASIDATDTTRNWTRQRVSFSGAQGDERMVLYLHLPANGSPPYQTVIYWPGSAAALLPSIDDYPAYLDFLLKDGRAVAFPVYTGTFERGGGSLMPFFGTPAYRDNTVAGVKDLRRSLDYLLTRPDIDPNRIAYFGHSWGGINGAVALAQEPRIRLGVIYVGFLSPLPMDPEVDPIDALPRVDVPVLMLSGDFDPAVPVETAERYFEMLGTRAADKKHVFAPGGHFVRRDVLIGETLEWLDRYFGRARPAAGR